MLLMFGFCWTQLFFNKNLVWILLLWVGLFQFRMSRFRETSVPSKNLWSRWKVIWKTVRSPQWKETSSQKSWRYPLFFSKIHCAKFLFCMYFICMWYFIQKTFVGFWKEKHWLRNMAMSVLKHFKSWQINNNFLSVK